MKYNTFGNTGEKVSTLGFGLMRLPCIEGDVEKIDETKASEMIRHAIESGVTYFDTAFPYHTKDFSKPGKSEPFLGKLLAQGYRDKIQIATKLPSFFVKTREDMDRFLQQQLERLGVEQIDCYLLHALNKQYWKTLTENGVFEFLDEAKASGKIKHIGFSFHDELPLFKEIVDAYDWDFCQIQYNFIDLEYQAGEEGLEYAYNKGLGIVIMEPLRGGSLCNLSEEDSAIFKEAGLHGSNAQVGLEYLFRDKRISVVLSGMSLQQHVEENIAKAQSTSLNPLTEEQKQAYVKVRQNILNKIKVPCTQCGYCAPCPVGVRIPYNFTLLNDFSMLRDANAKNRYQRFLKESERASNCVACGKCEERCPQNIKISTELKKVVTEFE